MLGAREHAVTDAFVVGGARTPRGKGSPKGALHARTPIELVTHLLAHLRVPADSVEDLVLAEVAAKRDLLANFRRDGDDRLAEVGAIARGKEVTLRNFDPAAAALAP